MKVLEKNCSRTINDVVLMKRGVFFNKSLLSDIKEAKEYHQYFEGDVYRYQLNLVIDKWVEFGDKMQERPKEFHWFEGDRILLRRLVNRRQRLMATLESHTFITNKNLYIIKAKDNTDIRIILGILNSKLISYLYLQQVTQATKDDFPQVTIRDILALPFPSSDSITNKQPKVVSLVEQMLNLNQQLAQAQTPQDKTMLKRQVEVTDSQIDKLVYELYNLTAEEIKIVEKGAG